jgi:hypothetical protein
VDPLPQGTSAFTLIGDAPSPRSTHTAVYDAGNDRMIVFGGNGNELWAQRLSAPNAGSWERIEAGGEAPPPGAAVLTIDEKSHRLMVFAADSLAQAWTLPLDGHGKWEVLGFNNAPTIALGFSLTTDPLGRKLYAYTSGQPEMWEIPLDGGISWTRIAGSPQNGGFSCRDTLVFDGEHGQLLVLSGGWPRGNVFALSLVGEPTWSKRNEDMAWFDYGALMLFDPIARRFMVMDPNQTTWLWSFSVDDETPKWTHLPIEASDHGQRWDGSAVYDEKHERAVLFGGIDAATQSLRDDTWALSLGDAPSWSQVGTLDRRMPSDLGASLAEASETGTIVRFGGNGSGSPGSSLRFDGKTGDWSALGDTPMFVYGSSAGAWDTSSHRLLTFGGYDSQQQSETAALDLASSTWTAVSDGSVRPSARSNHSMVADPTGKQMLVFGGMHQDETGTYAPVSDLWSFSVTGNAWTKLDPEGLAPAGRQAHATAFDDAGRRMLLHGGSNNEYNFEDTWMLELTPTPHWVALAPKGDAPPLLTQQFAAFDPDSRRFFVVGNLAQVSKPSSDLVGVWALSTEGEPRWQRYCPTGSRPGKVDGALWTERGLFLTSGASAWIFDTSSPLCD